MHARVSAARILSGQADELARKLNEIAIPNYQKQPGFAGAMVLIDREGGKGVVVTLWNSEAELKESERNASHRVQLDDVRQVTDVTFYEVAGKV